MKHLKYLIALVALFVVPLGIEAAPASAANCSFNAGGTYYNGSWTWSAQANSCTGVNAVQFMDAASTACCYMVDISRGNTVHFSYSGGGTYYAPHYPQEYPSYATQYNNFIWGSGCPNAFMVYKAFKVRIHNSNVGTWGSWVVYANSNNIEWIC